MTSHSKAERGPGWCDDAGRPTHLPTPEGWKAELALSGWLHTEINVRHQEPLRQTATGGVRDL